MSDFRTKANRVYMTIRLVIFIALVTYSILYAPESWSIDKQFCAGVWVVVGIGYIIKGVLPPTIWRYPH